jgi:2-polyprenyl-3-methyl-5-hydroxy-6-metoxy-1,4-benzoquinol methylase
MDNPLDFTRNAWNANAQVWDARMGDGGNDFFNVLCWPTLASFLETSTSLSPSLAPGARVLDIACGNGLTSRRLAALGAQVTAFDFSEKLIALAKQRNTQHDSAITYHVLDATDESQLFATLSPLAPFDAALSNMALFDMPEIEPLFRVLPKLLKPNGTFVFSLMHPAFNNPSVALMAEEWDDGELHMRYAVKVSRYMTPFTSKGLALRNQPNPQLYFHRPLQDYLSLAFQNGFILDGFAERAFPPDHPQVSTLGWGGKFSEIPPTVIIRLRLTTAAQSEAQSKGAY